MPRIDQKSWLDPLLPDSLPESILERASSIPTKAAFLAGLLAEETADQLTKLLSITNTYYSNLIEGQFTEPASIQHERSSSKRERKELAMLAVEHMHQQRVFERAITMSKPPFNEMFSPALIQLVHQRLFSGASEKDLRLADGRIMQPGVLRNGPQDEVVVGIHDAPAAASVLTMLSHLQAGFGKIRDPRRQLIAVLAYHHRLAWVHPFLDGNGRVARLVTHLQLFQLGLKPTLWSLARGLARERINYYRVLSNADRARLGDLDGRGQMSQRFYFEFIEFMLDVCIDQLDYMTNALDRSKLRERVIRTFKVSEELLSIGVKSSSAPAVIALLLQGKMPRSEFKQFLGLSDRQAVDELGRLISARVVISPTPKSRILLPGLPVWFAQAIFPDLHRRIQ